MEETLHIHSSAVMQYGIMNLIYSDQSEPMLLATYLDKTYPFWLQKNLKSLEIPAIFFIF